MVPACVPLIKARETPVTNPFLFITGHNIDSTYATPMTCSQFTLPALNTLHLKLLLPQFRIATSLYTLSTHFPLHVPIQTHHFFMLLLSVYLVIIIIIIIIIIIRKKNILAFW